MDPMTPAPFTKVLPVPLMSQADNASGQGFRECFSSAIAMVAAYHGKIGTDDEYVRLRARFGDTTDPDAHLGALRALGLKARFTTTANRSDLEREIRKNHPIAVGWLHLGPVTQPMGGGHWSVVAGTSPSGVWMCDPNGEAQLRRGGYLTSHKSWQGWYSWQNWLPRWDVQPSGFPGKPSAHTGWAIMVSKVTQPAPHHA